MPRSGRSGLSAIISWGCGDRFALCQIRKHLLAKSGVLAAAETNHRVLAAAKTRFHGIGSLAGEQDRAFEAAEWIEVVTVDEIFRGLLLAVVEVVPGAELDV